MSEILSGPAFARLAERYGQHDEVKLIIASHRALHAKLESRRQLVVQHEETIVKLEAKLEAYEGRTFYSGAEADLRSKLDAVERVTALIQEHFTGPHDGLEDLVRNVLQELVSNRGNLKTVESQLHAAQERVKALEAQIAGTKSKCLALPRCVELENLLTTAQARITQLEGWMGSILDFCRKNNKDNTFLWIEDVAEYALQHAQQAVEGAGLPDHNPQT